jgi:hypothetical protein
MFLFRFITIAKSKINFHHQVVAEIGSRIVIASSAVLFFISNQDLPYILEVAQRVNPGIKF